VITDHEELSKSTDGTFQHTRIQMGENLKKESGVVRQSQNKLRKGCC